MDSYFKNTQSYIGKWIFNSNFGVKIDVINALPLQKPCYKSVVWPWPLMTYCNCLKFSDRQVWAQIRLLLELLNFSNLRIITTILFLCPNYLDFDSMSSFEVNSGLEISCNNAPFQKLSRDMTKPTKWMCTQWRLRSAWASAQSDQSLRCALSG